MWWRCSKKKVVIVSVLAIYALIIFAPLVAYDYVYPNAGDDSAVHLYYLDKLNRGEPIGFLYFGRQIVGYPMIAVNRLFHVSLDTQFLWFNYAVLWLMGVAVFVMMKELVGWQYGLVGIPVFMFMSPAVLNLFDNGAIFDLMTVGIILPLFIVALNRTIATHQKYWLIALLTLFVLAVVIHSLAIFEMRPVFKQPVTPLIDFVRLLGWNSLLLPIVIAYSLKGMKWQRQELITLMVLGVIIILGALLAFTTITAWASRAAIELAILLSLLTAVLFGSFIKRCSLKLKVVGFCIVMVVSTPLVQDYFRYHNAIYPADKQAIAYVNTLGGEYFSVSPTINHRIYARLLNKVYKEGELPYIDRNMPMTSNSSPNTTDYWWGNKPLLAVDLSQARVFEGDGIVVKVINDYVD